jgi:hypothetical protein
MCSSPSLLYIAPSPRSEDPDGDGEIVRATTSWSRLLPRPSTLLYLLSLLSTYSRHRLTKSTNNGSRHRRAIITLLLPGFLFLPLLLVTQRGYPLESGGRHTRRYSSLHPDTTRYHHWRDPPGSSLTEEEPATRGVIDQLLRRPAQDFHDAGQLLDLVLAREERIASEELRENTAETPHVDGRAVGQSEDDLGTPVEPRLDVREDALVIVARRAEVDDLDRAAAPLLQQHVLLRAEPSASSFNNRGTQWWLSVF